jgi:hypothetical protein
MDVHCTDADPDEELVPEVDLLARVQLVRNTFIHHFSKRPVGIQGF